MQRSVLVTNGKSLIALSVVRSLACHDLNVEVVTDSYHSPVASSNAVNDCLLCPSALKEPNAFINFLEKVLHEKKYTVLFPVGTYDTLLISKYRYRLSQYCAIPFLPYEKIGCIHNKRNLVSICQKLDLRVPKTVVPSSVDEIEDIAATLSYPVVIKLQDTTGAQGLSHAASSEAFLKNYKATLRNYNLSDNELPLIQEYIPGIGYGVSCLYNRGKRRAFFTHKRIRELSPFGGASTCRESVRHPQMEDMAFQLLDYLEWHGVAMVEFKLDERTGEPYILEVNPRFWGSLAMAITAGVDFPWLLYRMAMAGDVPPVTDYRLGLRNRCLLSDAVSLIRHVKGRSISYAYFKDFFGFHGKKTHLEVFSWKDPKPFFAFITDHFAHGENSTR